MRVGKSKTRRSYCHDLSAASLINGAPKFGRPRFNIVGVVKASTLRSRRAADRAKQNRRDPVRYVYVGLPLSVLVDLMDEMKLFRPNDRKYKFSDREIDVEISEAVRTIMIARSLARQGHKK